MTKKIRDTYEVSEEHLKHDEPIPIKLLTPKELAGTVYYYEGFQFKPDIDTVEKDQDVDLSFSYEFIENPHKLEYQKCKDFEEQISLILIDILKERATKVIEEKALEKNGDTTDNIEEPVSK